MAEAESSIGAPSVQDVSILPKIESLLQAKDDTSRFVGLALLKSVLDHTSEIQHHDATVNRLWDSISPKFLDRLLRTGSGVVQNGQNPPREDAVHMLHLAASVLHAFVTLLPDQARRDERMVRRIPNMIPCLGSTRSQDTTRLLLETILTLVSRPEGAAVLLGLEDLDPLMQLAPTQPLVLEIIYFAFLSAPRTKEIDASLPCRLEKCVERLLLANKTSSTALLAFVDKLLRSVDPEILPPNPAWLQPLVLLIHNMFQDNSTRSLFMDPATAARCASYTNLAAVLLQAYPVQVPNLLFSPDKETERPFSYLFINLMLVDLRSSFPALLEQLNSPEYAETSKRLASAFDTLSSFIGYLVRSADHDAAPLPLPPDLLLRLRHAVSETMAATAQYLRDRWDASIAGAQGLHPEARPKAAANERLPVAWDAALAQDRVDADPLVLAAVRALALWLREDGGPMLAREAAGLLDMFVELYRTPDNLSHALDFRRPVLVALEAILAQEENVALFLDHGGWQALAADMTSVLDATSHPSAAGPDLADDARRGTDVVALVLLPLAAAERPGAREEWLDVVTHVAAWSRPKSPSPSVAEFQLSVLELVAALLENSPPAVRRRYAHSKKAVIDTAHELRRTLRTDPELVAALDHNVKTLAALS